MLILYGTETGTARDVALSLFHLARRYRVPDLQLASLEEADLVRLVDSDVALFVVSTSGNGAMPGGMQPFWSTLLRSDLAPFFEDLAFMLLGLGDSKYLQFNHAAKKLRRRLLQLGAHEVLPPVYCDESAPLGHDTLLQPFTRDWASFLRTRNADTDPVSPYAILPPVSPLHTVTTHETAAAAAGAAGVVVDEARYEAVTTENTRLTPVTHFQDVRRLAFHVTTHANHTAIEPGDIMSLWPANPAASVDRFLTLLDWQCHADKCVVWPAHHPSLGMFRHHETVTLREFVARSVPLHGVPSGTLFSQWLPFTTNDTYREKFEEWATVEGRDDMYDYLTRPRRTLLEVLEDFAAGLVVPLEHCIDVFGTTMPRRYSIAGAHATLSPGTVRVELLVAMVQYQTKIKEPRMGHASRYFAALTPNHATLLVEMRHPCIEADKMPLPDATLPLLLICTGTGFAPLCFFLTRLLSSSHAQQEETESRRHRVTLIYGCRSHDDNLVMLMLPSSLRSRITLHVAYSRMPGARKQYVQDVLAQQTQMVRDHVAKGRAYLCGSSGAMPDAARAAIDSAAGEGTVQAMEEQGRWWQETW